jgi:ketosteroid isomerase-like protein
MSRSGHDLTLRLAIQSNLQTRTDMEHGNTDKTGDWLQTIVAREQEHRRAFVACDFESLSDLWSDELVVNSPVNRVHNKQQVLALLRAGTIAHLSFEAELETIERRQNLLVVMGREVVVNSPGTGAISRRFTNVWRSQNGSWRLVVRHANIIPDAK